MPRMYANTSLYLWGALRMSTSNKRRRYSFKESEYKLPHTGKDRITAKRIIRSALQIQKNPMATESQIESAKPQAVLNKLKSKGLGYRKTNFLADYAKAGRIEHTWTHESNKKSKDFHNKVEQYRKLKNITNHNTALKAYTKDVSNYQGKLVTPEIEAFLNSLPPEDKNILKSD